MNTLTKARIVAAVPRRDWRFWAAFAAFCAVICVGFSLKLAIDRGDTLAADNRELKGQISDLSLTGECRSRAAAFLDDVKTEQSKRLAVVVVAAVVREGLETATAALQVSIDNLDIAGQARADAIARCTANPTYVIDPSILEPLPGG